MSAPSHRRIVCIVDSGMIGAAISTLDWTQDFTLVFEVKEVVDESHSYVPAVELLLENTKPKTVERITVPNPYFIGAGESVFNKVKRYRAFVQEVRRRVNLEPDVLYVGPTTSAIMRCVPSENRYYIDHGTGDYLRRVNPGFGLKERVANLLIGFGSESKDFMQLRTFNGSSMCKLKNDTFQHIDYRDLEVPESVRVYFEDIGSIAPNEGGVTLVLPTSAWHSERGFEPTPEYYEELNYRMISQHCCREESILLKFHPTFYQASNDPEPLVELLRKEGYNAVNLDSCLPVEVRGHLPAEIFVGYLNVSKVLAELSSTLFNVSHDQDVLPICCPYIFNSTLNRKDRILEYVTKINQYLDRRVSISNVH